MKLCVGRRPRGRAWALRLLLGASLLMAHPGFADESSTQPNGDPQTAAPPILRAPEASDALIREGLAFTAAGNLAAADLTWQRLREAVPEHPAGELFAIKSLQARRNLDWSDERYDAEIREHADAALALGEQWVERSPESAQAQFYLGHAFMELMLLDGMHGHYYRAGTEGEKGRKALERALELDPTLIDAKLPLGTYYYYASVATRWIRWLTWLWFVPTGEHDTGLAYVEETWHKGDLLRFSAGSTLSMIYTYMEDDPERGEVILHELHRLQPTNTYFQFEIVEACVNAGDNAGAIEAALKLERGTGTQFGDDRRRRMARLFRARAELYLGRTAEADTLLQPLEQDASELNAWSQRWLLLLRGYLLDLDGEREAAITRYEQVLAASKSRWGLSRTARLAQLGLDEPFRLAASEASVSGNAPPR